MDQDNAIRAAQQIGLAPGEEVVIQTDGQIQHPHPHSRSDTGPLHVDGWLVRNNNGTFEATKIHSDD